MHIQTIQVIELGTASAETRGCFFGFADLELGFTIYPGLQDD